MPRRPSTFSGVFLPSCVVGVGLFLLVALLLEIPLPLGWATRTEFSPELFQFRTTGWFVVFEAPLPSVQLGSRFDKLTRFLNDRGYIPSVEGTTEVRWHFVQGQHPFYNYGRGPAAWLDRALDGWGQGEEVWITWSQEHPRLARVLWPQVARWVRNAAYCDGYYKSHLLLWSVLDQSPQDPEELRALIRQIEQEEAEE